MEPRPKSGGGDMWQLSPIWPRLLAGCWLLVANQSATSRCCLYKRAAELEGRESEQRRRFCGLLVRCLLTNKWWLSTKPRGSGLILGAGGWNPRVVAMELLHSPRGIIMYTDRQLSAVVYGQLKGGDCKTEWDTVSNWKHPGEDVLTREIDYALLKRMWRKLMSRYFSNCPRLRISIDRDKPETVGLPFDGI